VSVYDVKYGDGDYGFGSDEHYELYVERPVAFILQYELDRDPFETFATMAEVEARIKELAKRADLKRESIKVYEIAKTYDVKLETRVFFGPRVKMEEQKPKRGRPRKSDMSVKEKRAAYNRAYYKRKKAQREAIATGA
jgi:hypothetical protein